MTTFYSNQLSAYRCCSTSVNIESCPQKTRGNAEEEQAEWDRSGDVADVDVGECLLTSTFLVSVNCEDTVH